MLDQLEAWLNRTNWLPDRLLTWIADRRLEGLARRARMAYEAMTPEQQAAHTREQKVSFVIGNLRLDGIHVTREQAEAAVDAAQSARASRGEAG